MDFGSTFMAVLTGLGLSAACGFRVFIPPLIVGIAAQTGNLELAESFSWVGEWPTLIALGIATVCDFIGHEIPAVDDMLNVVEAPLAAIAGTVLSEPQCSRILTRSCNGGLPLLPVEGRLKRFIFQDPFSKVV